MHLLSGGASNCRMGGTSETTPLWPRFSVLYQVKFPKYYLPQPSAFKSVSRRNMWAIFVKIGGGITPSPSLRDHRLFYLSQLLL